MTGRLSLCATALELVFFISPDVIKYFFNDHVPGDLEMHQNLFLTISDVKKNLFDFHVPDGLSVYASASKLVSNHSRRLLIPFLRPSSWVPGGIGNRFRTIIIRNFKKKVVYSQSASWPGSLRKGIKTRFEPIQKLNWIFNHIRHKK
jgi:hypothetical protein